VEERNLLKLLPLSTHQGKKPFVVLKLRRNEDRAGFSRISAGLLFIVLSNHSFYCSAVVPMMQLTSDPSIDITSFPSRRCLRISCRTQGHRSLTPIALKESILELEATPALHQVLHL
jgi:hypothetical protein